MDRLLTRFPQLPTPTLEHMNTSALITDSNKEQAEFEAYRASEEAKKFKVRDKFGFSRYATLAEAQAFAATLDDAEIIHE